MNQQTYYKYSVRQQVLTVRCVQERCSLRHYTTPLDSWILYQTRADRNGYRCMCGSQEFVEVTN